MPTNVNMPVRLCLVGFIVLPSRKGCAELKMGSAKFPPSWKRKHLLRFCSTSLKH